MAIVQPLSDWFSDHIEYPAPVCALETWSAAGAYVQNNSLCTFPTSSRIRYAKFDISMLWCRATKDKPLITPLVTVLDMIWDMIWDGCVQPCIQNMTAEESSELSQEQAGRDAWEHIMTQKCGPQSQSSAATGQPESESKISKCRVRKSQMPPTPQVVCCNTVSHLHQRAILGLDV